MNAGAINDPPTPAAQGVLPKVVVVILNWNDAEVTIACLDALRSTEYPNFTTIVVDNGSTNNSAARLRGVTGIDLVVSSTNLGYAGGVNVGIERAIAAGADYVWLLNNDAVAHSDVLSRLVTAAEADEQIGLVSPVFNDPDNPDVIEFLVGRFDPRSCQMSQTADSVVAAMWQHAHPNEIILLGTALLIRRRLVEAIGTLDAGFFAYVEDVDYCLRAHAAGFRVIPVPAATVGHKFKQPIENPNDVPSYLHYFITRNYLLLWRKLPGRILFRSAAVWFLYQRLTQIKRLRGAPAPTDAVLAGLWDGLRGVGGPYQPTRRAPWLLRAAVGKYPGFWLALIDGKTSLRRSTP